MYVKSLSYLYQDWMLKNGMIPLVLNLGQGKCFDTHFSFLYDILIQFSAIIMWLYVYYFNFCVIYIKYVFLVG